MLFQYTIREAGLNPYYFELADILAMQGRRSSYLAGEPRGEPRELLGIEGGVFKGMVERSGEKEELERGVGAGVGVVGE